MPAVPPGSEDGILNTYAEGILGKYTAEFAGAWSAFHFSHAQHCGNITSLHMQKATQARKFCVH